jgi:hypothetical protein
MANEIIVDFGTSGTGKTVTAKVYNADVSAQIGSTVSLSESGEAAGVYVGDAPSGMADENAGHYLVRIFDGGSWVGSASLAWTGTEAATPLTGGAVATGDIVATIT